MIWHFYQLEGNRPANTGIGGNGGWTSKFQLQNKARQQSGVDQILEQNALNSNSKILKVSAAGQTN